MKAPVKLSILSLVMFVLVTGCATTQQASAQSEEYWDDDDDYRNSNSHYGGVSVNFNMFMQSLSPYGRWVSYPSYGRVWICNEPGFIPYYTRGHWVFTSAGWTWASDYRWGWAPFHYGRWAYDPFYGWMWVPGYEWGPAWVGWRSGGDYYGWAPLAPGINISIGFSFGNAMPADRWCFVPRRHMASPHFSHYRVDRSRNTTIINNTTVINNTTIYRNTKYVAGPERREVEKYYGKKINALKIADESKPGTTRVDKNSVRIYRPGINKKDDDRHDQFEERGDRIVKPGTSNGSANDKWADKQKSVKEGSPSQDRINKTYEEQGKDRNNKQAVDAQVHPGRNNDNVQLQQKRPVISPGRTVEQESWSKDGNKQGQSANNAGKMQKTNNGNQPKKMTPAPGTMRPGYSTQQSVQQTGAIQRIPATAPPAKEKKKE